MNNLISDFEWEIFLVMLALVILGLVMILSASAVSAYEMMGLSEYFFYRQVIWTLVGLVGCFIAATLPMDLVKNLTPIVYLGVFVLLLLVLLPFIGHEASGAWRWISLGVVGFQPSEFAKLALVMILAYYFSEVRLRPNNRFKHLISVLVITFLYVFLVAVQPDLGTASQIGLLGVIVLFVVGYPLTYLAPVIIMSLPIGALTVFSSGYRSERVIAYLNPWADPYGKGYHMVQSIKALARGGLSGLGMGESIAKQGLLPEPYTDSIVAVIGEELGFIGIALLVLFLSYLIFKGFSVSLKCRNAFGKLLAAGIASMIGIQVLINLAVVCGMIPTTGVAMPFISYGGSSLFVHMIAIGLLMNVSRDVRNV